MDMKKGINSDLVWEVNMKNVTAVKKYDYEWKYEFVKKV